jgi:myo-inositol-1(or 4)-monophosphatase
MERFISQLARRVGLILKREFSANARIAWREKAKSQIVTKADLLANRLILKAIRARFPAHGILSEETGRSGRKSDYLWVVDPLDGTTNFTVKQPFFAVSIGLVYREEPILGVIYSPMLDELFSAERGKGSRLNNRPIHVSDTGKLNQAFLTFCYGSRLPDLKRAIHLFTSLKLTGEDFRQFGSASLESAYVASGRTEAIIIPGAHAWDVAAGAVIVREAGGRVTDFHDQPWSIQSQDYLATNAELHPALIRHFRHPSRRKILLG